MSAGGVRGKKKWRVRHRDGDYWLFLKNVHGVREEDIWAMM